MANYVSCTTTNYFQVTSEQELRDLVSRIDCADEIEISSATEKGKTYYSLCAYGSFLGLIDNDVTDDLYKEFQRILPDGEVLVIFEIGHEKLRYVGGSTAVITNETYQYKSLKDVAETMARNITSNPAYELLLYGGITYEQN